MGTKFSIAVDLEAVTKDNWMVKMRLFLATIFFVFSFVLVDKTTALSTKKCFSNASGCDDLTCNDTEICKFRITAPSGYYCEPAAPGECPSNECTAHGCGPSVGCDEGELCQTVGSFLKCVTNAIQCPASCPNVGACCGVGLKCSSQKTCVPAPSGECQNLGQLCTVVGSCSECAPGMVCSTWWPRNRCDYDTQGKCSSVVPVPYGGPIIHSLPLLIGTIYNIFFPAALLIGVLMIIKGGYELMTSEGNPQLAKVGQEDLTSAILGILFILMAALILRMVIQEILGGTVSF